MAFDMSFVIIFFFWTVGVAKTEAKEQPTSNESYKLGEPVLMQCKNSTKSWGKGPICRETGAEMVFPYGTDTFHYCGISIDSNEMYSNLSSLISRDENWNCRISIAPTKGNNEDFFIPFTIPIWGAQEPSHLHIDNHLNFVFHADSGKIIAAAAYPVRDKFQFIKTGAVLALHGPVKWFHKHSFKDVSQNTFNLGAVPNSALVVVSTVFLWCCLIFILSFIAFSVAWKYYYKPKLLKTLSTKKNTIGHSPVMHLLNHENPEKVLCICLSFKSRQIILQ